VAVEVQSAQQRARLLASLGTDADKACLQGNVLERGEEGQKVVGLEDKADVAAAPRRALLVVEASQVGIEDGDGPFGGSLERTDERDQRRLATTAGAHDRQCAALRNPQVDAVDGVNVPRRGAVVTLRVAYIDCELLDSSRLCGGQRRLSTRPSTMARRRSARSATTGLWVTSSIAKPRSR
jgi:hypothetical protein